MRDQKRVRILRKALERAVKDTESLDLEEFRLYQATTDGLSKDTLMHLIELEEASCG